MGKSVSSVFQTHFTHTTWGTTQIFIPRLLLGSRAILAFFECTADKTPDTELTRNYAQNSKCLKLSTIHLLNMLDNSCTLRGYNYVFPSLETASKLEQNQLNSPPQARVQASDATNAFSTTPAYNKLKLNLGRRKTSIYFGLKAPSFTPQSSKTIFFYL